MKKKNSCSENSAVLRAKAEEQLQSKPSASDISNIFSGEAEMLKLIHELKVHQIELEMQNDERKQADEALRISEVCYRTLFENSLSGILITQPNGTILNANPEACRLLERSEQDICQLGRNGVANLTDPNLAVALETRRREGHFCGELTFVRADGTIFPVYLASNTVSSSTGQFNTNIFFKDITARKKAENKLNESEKRYRELVENSPDAILIYVEGNIVMVNRECLRLMATENEDELIGKPVMQFVHPDYRELVIERMGKVVLEGSILPLFEEKFVRIDGSEVDVEVKAVAIKFDNKRAVQLIIRDVTERKLAELALYEMNWRLESIVKGEHVGTWEWNIQTGETVFNDVWTQIVGYSLEELSPVSIKTWELLVHPDDLVYSNELLQKHFEGELPYYDFDCRMKHKDGHWLWVHSRGRVVSRTDDGKPLMMFGTHSDITRRKNIEETLRKNEENLQKIIAEKDKFFSIIAHDLRSPFNGFLGLTEIMVEGFQGMKRDEIQQMAVLIQRSATNLYSLLGNLLEWSRMQRGLTGIVPASFLLMSKISESMVLVNDAAGKKEITISYEVPDDLTVFADENMLGGIVRNLVTNAVKFTRQGGIILISARSVPGNLAEVSVRDTGIGMSKDLIDNLFRLDVNTGRKGTAGEYSTGLGLIICKDFIEKNGGELFIESEEGEGSNFKFTVPTNSDAVKEK